jgi:undecaprenyl-diphosphatase
VIIYYIAFLALVQGITEFLPISSSAHLILGRDLLDTLGLPVSHGTASDQLAFDIALHIGSLGAVVIYFWRDVWEMILGAFDGVRGRGGARFRLLLMVVIATVPIIIIGFAAKDVVETLLRATEIIAWTTLIFGIALWLADRKPLERHDPIAIGYKDAVIVGLMQCLAIIPGVSRSGITMTAGRMLGFDRPLSARFATLLSLPTIAGAGLLGAIDLSRSGNASLTADALVGGAMAFVIAFLAIALLMRWLRSASYMPFVVYRIVLGVFLLVLIYGFGWSPVA